MLHLVVMSLVVLDVDSSKYAPKVDRFENVNFEKVYLLTLMRTFFVALFLYF